VNPGRTSKEVETMPSSASLIDRSSDIFSRQRQEMLDLVSEVETLERKIEARSASRTERFRKRGQLLPRERLALLFDPGEPQLPLSALAGLRMYDDDGEEEVLGAALIVRVGIVHGVRVMAICHDSAIKGGATSPIGLAKFLRAQDVAMQNRLPIVMLVESAGANLTYQSEMFIQGGKRFFNMARLSAAGIPQIAVVHGSSTAGGAYIPGMSDYTIMVRNKSKMFLAGPPLLKAATGEIADDEELGGALMHSTVAGTVEFVAEDDGQAVEIARSIVANLGWSAAEPLGPGGPPPLHDVEELAGVVPPDYRQPYDIKEIVIRLVDRSETVDFKPGFGANMLCCMAEVEGMPCAFIGNNGPIQAAEAAKTAQFIQLCTQARKPIVFLQNTTGFMVGVEAERSGIIKHGAKMLQAVANTPVPKITLVVGGSFGAGNFAMCNRSYEPRFIFAWPNSRVAVMGGDQAIRVLDIIREQKSDGPIEASDQAALDQQRQEILERYDRESTALYATARLWDDGIIDPRDSRQVLAFCLATCRDAEKRPLAPITFGVGRM
jgi:geranyl-CoA carboxylase beta subunit